MLILIGIGAFLLVINAGYSITKIFVTAGNRRWPGYILKRFFKKSRTLRR